MTTGQALIFAIIAGTIVLFLWGRLRHDIVALIALSATVLTGLVDGAAAFQGFSQPAVITVACVLVLSRALQVTGAVDALARRVLPERGGITLAMGALLSLGALLSAFMNNVGAMALLMPVAVRLAQRHNVAPGQVLMPLAFATMLGGMVTLIGTPPNLIVSGIRAEAGLGPYRMFDFAPVGLAVAIAGVLAMALVVWRLVPARVAAGDDFAVGSYLTELLVPEGSPTADLTLLEAEDELSRAGAQITGLVRGAVHMTAPRGSRRIAAGDILIVEGEIDALTDSLSRLGLTLAPSHAAEAERAADGPSDAATAPPASDIQIKEFVVRPGSDLVGRSAMDLALRTRLGVNLLAVSREGRRQTTRLRETRLAPGDLLLVQGPSDTLALFGSENGIVPLAERGVSLPDRRGALSAALFMGLGVALAGFGILPTAVAFLLAVLGVVLTGALPLRMMYDSIDWSVIVLLGALMPVAAALETTGAAELVARTLVDGLAGGRPLVALALVLVVTMMLSDVMNNAATAAVMCPIALGIAGVLGANPDSFLMAVAIGASCAFLTPIGHQNNTLILGPGGFRFGDYWRPGLLIELVVIAVSLLLLPVVWPL